jgi:hypothetical protein
VATSRKPLWLLLRRYSGSTIAVVCSSDMHRDVRRLSLLWSVAAIGTMTTGARRYYAISSDERLTSRCPSLLGVTAATGNLTSDYQLLLDRFKFRHTCKHSQILVYQAIIIRHIDRI